MINVFLTLKKLLFVLTTILIFASCSKKSNNNPSKIGETKFGGVIFYFDNSGMHGLVAAPSDQSPGVAWDKGNHITTGAKDSAVGTGSSNTAAIIVAQGNANYAAYICKNLTLNGYSDWYLPSKAELNLMFTQKSVIGGLNLNSGYWSSTEKDSVFAWAQAFNNGLQFPDNKVANYPVRAIRSF